MKFTMHLLKLLALFSFVALILQSCDPDPDPEEPQELITNLSYTLTPSNGEPPVVLTFSDIDGDGGDAPIINGGSLAAGTTYTGVIELSDESKTPIESITEEIDEEADEHQFFFSSTNSIATVSYDDTDSMGNPVGLSTTLVTAADSVSGSLTITLRHEPNKSASGVAGGDITNAGGETDIEVSFPIDVQ